MQIKLKRLYSNARLPEFSTDNFYTSTGAIFSPNGMYRYKLWRTWDASTKPACFVMLNPSTADEVMNDPTVERCERRAWAMGYGGLIVVNIFAFRSTDPVYMKAALDPVGPENDRYIAESAKESGMVICAWGNHGRHKARSAAVQRLLSEAGVQPHALKLSATGEPWHPLYVAYAVQPKPWPEVRP